MTNPNLFLRTAFAVVLLFTQMTGGFASVVHCYDSNCESAGINWECHAHCGENHGLGGQTCGHQHDCSINEPSLDDREKHSGESLIGSKLCGDDHHHHYAAAVDLICTHAENSVDDCLRGFCDDTCLEPLQPLLADSASRPLLALDRGVGFHPAIPLVLRLRI